MLVTAPQPQITHHTTKRGSGEQGQQRACPDVGAHRARPPVEAVRVFDHVELLAPVAAAGKGDGEAHRRQRGHQFIHVQR